MIGMLASGWHRDRQGQRWTHLNGSLILVCASFALIAVAETPGAMITGYLVLHLVWPAVTLSMCLVLTEIVEVRMVAVPVAFAVAIGLAIILR